MEFLCRSDYTVRTK